MEGGLVFLETNGQPIRFPSKAEEPRQGTTEVSKQIALSSGPELCGSMPMTCGVSREERL
jgi:hypothetical protein